MTRRTLAKKQMPATFRAWVKDYKGKGLLGGYRKHFHVSWSCAIVELSMMGVSFPPEELEEAKRKQIDAVQAHKAKKAKKAAAKEFRNLDLSNPEFQLPHGWRDLDPNVVDGMYVRDSDPKQGAIERVDRIFDKPTISTSDQSWQRSYDPFDDYDPFAE